VIYHKAFFLTALFFLLAKGETVTVRLNWIKSADIADAPWGIKNNQQINAALVSLHSHPNTSQGTTLVLLDFLPRPIIVHYPSSGHESSTLFFAGVYDVFKS
jgi:hypothetical protein